MSDSHFSAYFTRETNGEITWDVQDEMGHTIDGNRAPTVLDALEQIVDTTPQLWAVINRALSAPSLGQDEESHQNDGCDAPAGIYGPIKGIVE